MGFTTLLVLSLLAAAVWAVLRGVDARLALLAAALAVGTVTGSVSPIVREFLGGFSNEKFVVPICTAMGFAYVLKHTGCERHLVLLLIEPLRYTRGLLVPGVVVVGFLANVPVISQTSTAICLGPVAIPLLRAAGYSMTTIGACLLLGVSVGGELLNPGAPELLAVFDKTGVPTAEQARRYLPPLVFTQLAVSTALFWLLSLGLERGEKSAAGDEAALDAAPKIANESHDETATATAVEPAAAPADEPPREPIQLLKAFVPLVPLALLFASGLPAPYNLFETPDAWVALPKEGRRDPAYATRLIGLAMLVGTAVAMAAAPSKAKDCVKQFFDGAGYGFAHIVSLIVTANCFGVAIRDSGLAAHLGQAIQAFPQLLSPLAAFVPLAFAAVSGSGMASTQSLYGFFHGPAVALGVDPTAVGALVGVGSAAGRTMSPVAAVVLMCASLTGTKPLELVKRVAPPLLVGLTVVVALRAAAIL